MSVVARVGTAAGAEDMLTCARPSRRAFPRTKRASAVVAVALLVLAAFAALIPASEVPNADHYSAGSTDDQPGAVSQPAAPQISEEEALDAYEKLPLSFVPKRGGQTGEAVRSYARSVWATALSSPQGATFSYADGEGRGHALALNFLGRPRRDARSPKAACRRGQLPGGGRRGRVAPEPLQNLRVVDVGRLVGHYQWDASPVAHNMALRARFSLVRRIRSGSRPPGATTLAESKEVLSHSAHRQQLGVVPG